MAEKEIIRAVITIGAVFLGFILGQVSEWIKSIRFFRQKKRSIRKLIDLEVGENISQIKTYWDKLLKSREAWESEKGKLNWVQLAEDVANDPFPIISDNAWVANIGEVSSAYNESELVELWDIYNNINKLYSLHLFFVEAADERRDTDRFYYETHGSGMGTLIGGTNFAHRVEGHTLEFKKLIEKILNYQSNA